MPQDRWVNDADVLLNHLLLLPQDTMDGRQVSATLREAKGKPQLRGRAAAVLLSLMLQSPSPSHQGIKKLFNEVEPGDLRWTDEILILDGFDNAIAKGHRGLSNLRRMFINRFRPGPTSRWPYC